MRACSSLLVIGTGGGPANSELPSTLLDTELLPVGACLVGIADLDFLPGRP